MGHFSSKGSQKTPKRKITRVTRKQDLASNRPTSRSILSILALIFKLTVCLGIAEWNTVLKKMKSDFTKPQSGYTLIYSVSGCTKGLYMTCRDENTLVFLISTFFLRLAERLSQKCNSLLQEIKESNAFKRRSSV